MSIYFYTYCVDIFLEKEISMLMIEGGVFYDRGLILVHFLFLHMNKVAMKKYRKGLTMRIWAYFVHSYDFIYWVRVPSLAPEKTAL